MKRGLKKRCAVGLRYEKKNLINQVVNPFACTGSHYELETTREEKGHKSRIGKKNSEIISFFRNSVRLIHTIIQQCDRIGNNLFTMGELTKANSSEKESITIHEGIRIETRP